MGYVPVSSRGKWSTSLRRLAQTTGMFKIITPQHSGVMPFGKAQPAVAIQLADGSERRLAIERRSRLLPAEARGLAGFLNCVGGDAVAISCPFISPAVAEICERAGINYFDDVGNARIKLPGCLIKISGQNNANPVVQTPRELFAQKSSRVTRLLLENPERNWAVQELGAEAQISLGLASRVCTALIDEGYLIEGERLRLRDAENLLKKWADSYKAPPRLDAFVMENPIEKVEQRMMTFCQRHNYVHALAEFSGAWRLAPHVKHMHASLTVPAEVLGDLKEHLLGEREVHPVQSGANMSFVCARDKYDFYNRHQVEGIHVLSPISLYVQLRNNPARGAEAAGELLRMRIRPRFENAKVLE